MTSSTEIWRYQSEIQPSAPQAMQSAEAQKWCNFVILEPITLPSGCRIPSAGTLRKESPPVHNKLELGQPDWTKSRASSYLIHVGGGNRLLRLKQFLYDWAPPATDHPCLWGHQERPFVIDGQRVGWLSIDFKGNAAVSAMLYGTMCEVSVLKGEFGDNELIALYKGLQPVNSNAKDSILHTPFAKLCYWAKYECDLVDVPFGLWRFRRNQVTLKQQWDTKFPPKFANLQLSLPVNWRLDSCCTTGDDNATEEVEAIYILDNRDRYLWYRAVLKDGVNRLPMPPQKDEHPCKCTVHNIAGIDVYHAWIDDNFGPHDAVWQHQDLSYMIQANSAVGFDTNAFVELLRTMLNSSRHNS